MKKTLLFIIATIIVASLTTSCNPNYADKIVGQWEIIDMELLSGYDETNNMLKLDGLVIEFESDGTIMAYLKDGPMTIGVWQVNGNRLAETYYLFSDQFFFDYNIVKMTKNSLTLQGQMTSTLNDNNVTLVQHLNRH